MMAIFDRPAQSGHALLPDAHDRVETVPMLNAHDNDLTVKYPWRSILLVSLAISGIILAIQFPITIYSPDGSFHAAKILRASGGEFFTDPFTGLPTIYPSLFHLIFGLISRALGLTSIQTVQAVVIVDFIGLFAAFYYLARPFFRTAEATSLCVLSLSLVVYAPQSHYILLPQPSSFSFVFLIGGIGALYRYSSNRRPLNLIIGGLLSSLAINIWWAHIFTVGPILAVLSWHTFRKGLIPKPAHCIGFICAFAVPCSYTAWHFYSIVDILPNYQGDISKQWNLRYLVRTWLITFVTKGNLQFLHHFNFWDLTKAPSATSSLLSDNAKILYSGVSSVHYFLLVLPFNWMLLGYVSWSLFPKRNGQATEPGLTKTLAVAGIGVFLSSAVMLMVLAEGHLRRVQFVVYILLLLYCYQRWADTGSRLIKNMSSYVGIAALFALLYTVVYSPRVVTNMAEIDRQVISFIESLPNHARERIFMSDDGLRRIAPFVTFESFGERSHRHHLEDPITAVETMKDFVSIREKGPEWRRVIRERKLKWLVFRTSIPRELDSFEKYAHEGTVRLRNRDWVVVELSV